jgi:8-oxo-dGTP pyrophosphatase MutT (NUDIX family)
MKKVVPLNAVLIPDEAKQVFSGVIFDIYQWQQKLYDGSFTTFEMLKRFDTVSTICIVDDKIIVLDEKQPPNISRRSFPGGRVDKSDQDIENAAKREVLEETGYSFKPSSEVEWFVYLYVAWNSSGKVETRLDAGEQIELSLYDIKTTKALVDEDEHIGHNRDIFRHVDSIDGLINYTEYKGDVIDR